MMHGPMSDGLSGMDEMATSASQLSPDTNAPSGEYGEDYDDLLAQMYDLIGPVWRYGGWEHVGLWTERNAFSERTHGRQLQLHAPTSERRDVLRPSRRFCRRHLPLGGR